MTLELIREKIKFFPLQSHHGQFFATGRAIPSSPNPSTEKFIIISISTPPTGVTSSSIGIPQYEKWWNTVNATVDCVTLQMNLDAGADVNDVAARWIESDSTEEPTTPELQEEKIEEFLEEVYRLAKFRNVESATDRVFDFIDKLLCDDEFVICDEILKRVDVDKLPTTLMRSFLTITHAAKGKLPARQALYRKIDRKMAELKGANKAGRIIGSLA